MSDKSNTNLWKPDAGFEPFDPDAHARDLEANDPFGSRLVEEGHPGDLARKLERMATSGDPGIIAALEESGVDDPRVPRTFYLSGGQPAKIYADSEGWHSVLVIDGQQHKFTSAIREKSMFLAEQYMAQSRGPRKLSPTEELRIARLAESGESVEALELYVKLRLGEDHRSAEAILTDPILTPLLNDAARFVFRCSRQDFEPDDAFEALLDRVAETRPLTIRILDCLYDRFLDQKSEAARGARRAVQPAAPESEHIPNQAEVQNELENMNDVELAKLRLKTIRHRAELVRRFDAQIGR
jgi:hypothetical protein